jgi:hypothetical protein
MDLMNWAKTLPLQPKTQGDPSVNVFSSFLGLLPGIASTSRIVAAVIEIAIRIRAHYKQPLNERPPLSDMAYLIMQDLPTTITQRYGVTAILQAIEETQAVMETLHLGKEAKKTASDKG